MSVVSVNLIPCGARLTSPGFGIEPPPIRPASETEWWGERNAWVVSGAPLAGGDGNADALAGAILVLRDVFGPFRGLWRGDNIKIESGGHLTI